MAENSRLDRSLDRSGAELTSPDGKVTMSIALDDCGQLSFSAAKGKQTAIETSRIGITTTDVDFDGGGLSFGSKPDATVDESYALPLGKKATYTDKANEMTLKFTKGDSELDVIARTYDDGVAWRLRLPGSGAGSNTAPPRCHYPLRCPYPWSGILEHVGKPRGRSASETGWEDRVEELGPRRGLRRSSRTFQWDSALARARGGGSVGYPGWRRNLEAIHRSPSVVPANTVH